MDTQGNNSYAYTTLELNNIRRLISDVHSKFSTLKTDLQADVKASFNPPLCSCKIIKCM